MSTVPYLQGILKGLMKGRKEAEKPLNARPHFIPISLTGLKVSMHHLGDDALDTFFTRLEEYVSKYPRLDVYAFQTYKLNGLKIDTEELLENLKKRPMQVWSSSGNLVGLLTNSYSAAYNNLFKDFLNKELTAYVNKALGSEGFDVGHTFISSDKKYTDLANTPLSLQVENVLQVLDAFSSTGAGAALQAELKRHGIIKDTKFRSTTSRQNDAARAFNTIQESFQRFKEKHTYGQQISVKLNKDIKGLLLNVSANIVLIQDRTENQVDFANLEKALQKEISEILPRIHFSKSLEEEAIDRLEEVILFGKVKSGSVSVSKKLEEKQVTKQKVTVTATTAKPNPTVRLRNTKGRFVSLINVENLIRAQLRETIQKNMTKPALVYRTGRFANSVKLDSVANRNGELIAFLSYMRYPYATFEPGNRQGSVDRSPTRLIDRSVREIAKNIVTARLRTVVS